MEHVFSEAQLMFQDMVRDFVVNEIEPRAARWDETEQFPYETIRKMAGLELFGVPLPPAYGGNDDEICFVLATEELSRGSAGLGVIYLVNSGLGINPVVIFGNAPQKTEYLGRVMRGDICAFGLTETAAGSDVAALQAGYRRAGEDYLLNGSKVFITNGAEADFVIVFATRDRSLGHGGISAFIVETEREGFSVGKKERKMGLHPASAAELILDDCRVPAANLVGEEGEGFKIAMMAIDASRVSIAAQSVGIARAASDAALAYARDRRQFGRELTRFQAIQWMIADMATEIDAARLLTYRAARLIQDREDYVKEAAMAKLFASEAAHRVCHKALQIFGGYGYTKEFPVERYVRDQRITEIYEGTSEMQRLTIARRILDV